MIYADYSQEEYYIAARLSGDLEIQRLYAKGDPYIAFGIMANLLSDGATKQSHPEMREILKTVSLSVMYDQWVLSMALKLGISVNRAENLLAEHQYRFPQVWYWFKQQIKISYARQRSLTQFGWYLKTGSRVRERTIRNFPVQGTAADILRVAHLLLLEAGIRVCCPVHDAFLIETNETNLEKTACEVVSIMAQAGKDVIGGRFDPTSGCANFAVSGSIDRNERRSRVESNTRVPASPLSDGKRYSRRYLYQGIDIERGTI